MKRQRTRVSALSQTSGGVAIYFQRVAVLLQELHHAFAGRASLSSRLLTLEMTWQEMEVERALAEIIDMQCPRQPSSQRTPSGSNDNLVL